MKKSVLYRIFTVALAVMLSFGEIVSLKVNAEEMPLNISYENRAEIEQTILAYIDENKDTTPAVSIMVFDNEQNICSVIYGEANRTEHIQADENTVYEWGSVTKLLVWTCVMQLYEQGKLDLNEDIRTYLPDGYLKNLSYDKPVTMLDLMNHSAGFQETVGEIETDDLSKLKPLGKALTDTAPAQTSPPGETVSYSNWGAALAGYIVECISGMDFSDYVNENIFSRLGMEHTYIRPDISDNQWAAEQRRKTNCYANRENGLLDLGECRRYIHLYPAGSAGGTISDLATFAKAFLCDSKDCPLFEKEDTLDRMLSPSRYFSDGTTPRICHGIFYSDDGEGLYGHGGNTEGFSSELELDIKNKTGMVMMTNKQGDRTYTNGLVHLLYGSYAVPSETNFEKADLSGHYKMGRSSYGAGVLSIYGFFEDSLVIEEKNGAFVHADGIATFTQISESVVVMELITGSKSNLIIRKDANGNVTALELFQAIDYVKESPTDYYTDLMMIVLMAVSAAIMSILFVVHIIRLKKYKEQNVYLFKRMEMLSALTVPAMVIDAVTVGVVGWYSLTVPCIIIGILAVAEAVLIIICWCVKEKPKNKVLLVIETICSALIIAGIIYWKLYQFWGF